MRRTDCKRRLNGIERHERHDELLKPALFRGPSLFHQREQVRERFLVAAPFRLGELPGALIELRGHLGRLLRGTAESNEGLRQSFERYRGHASIKRGRGALSRKKLPTFAPSRFTSGVRMKTNLIPTLAAGLLLVAAHTMTAADKPLADGLYAEMNTSKGKIVLRLEFEKTPLTVANFVGLSEGTRTSNKPKGTKFYDGLVFHRVIPDFMIQGGDPEGSGRGGPGYKFGDEFDSSLKHDGPGVFSMANAGPGTNGSQFFITHKETPWLDGKHSVFGRVVEGQDVVNKIAGGDKLVSVKIIRVGKKAEAFKSDDAAFDALSKGAGKRVTEAAENAQKDVLTALEKAHGKITTTASGMKYVTLAAGKGDKAGKDRKIKAHYTGKLLDGQVFDSSVKRNEPFEFTVGIGQVIKGWDEALSDMKKGEKRIIVLPPDLAYGARGAGGAIPPNATLVFEVELLDF